MKIKYFPECSIDLIAIEPWAETINVEKPGQIDIVIPDSELSRMITARHDQFVEVSVDDRTLNLGIAAYAFDIVVDGSRRYSFSF